MAPTASSLVEKVNAPLPHRRELNLSIFIESPICPVPIAVPRHLADIFNSQITVIMLSTGALRAMQNNCFRLKSYRSFQIAANLGRSTLDTRITQLSLGHRLLGTLDRSII